MQRGARRNSRPQHVRFRPSVLTKQGRKAGGDLGRSGEAPILDGEEPGVQVLRLAAGQAIQGSVEGSGKGDLHPEEFTGMHHGIAAAVGLIGPGHKEIAALDTVASLANPPLDRTLDQETYLKRVRVPVRAKSLRLRLGKAGPAEHDNLG